MKTSTKILMALDGILMIALGIVCLCNYQETLISISWIIGLMMICSGVFSLFMWIYTHNFMFNSGTILLNAILDFVMATFFIGRDSLIAASAMPIVFGFWACFAGASLAIRSFDFKQVHFSKWWMLLILGIAGTILGIFSLIEPVVGAEAISIFLGIAIILIGVSHIVALFGINKFEKNVKKLIYE